MLPKARDDLTAPHLPTHDFVKIRANITTSAKSGASSGTRRPGSSMSACTRLGRKLEGAVIALRRGDLEANDFLAERKVATPTCVSCEALVTVPCWYYIDYSGAHAPSDPK